MTKLIRSFEFKIFLLAVVVRLLFVALFPGVNYYNGITNEYLNAANNLVHGNGLNVWVDIAPFNSGQVHFAFEPFIARPIGYVLFCASVLGTIGFSVISIQFLQAIVTAMSAVLVYRLSREVFEFTKGRDSISRFAAIFAAVWPNQARFEIALLPDGLTTLIMLGLALTLTRYAKHHATKHLVQAALLLALSIFLRPDLVLFPGFLFLALLLMRQPREAVKGSLVIGLVLAAAIGLNTWKNWEVGHKIVPLNLGSGTTMYEGISQFGDTLGTTYADERLAHQKFNTKELFYPNGVENDRMVWQEAIDTIKHHPWYYATVVARRIPLMFTVRGLYFSDTVNLSDPNNDLAKRFPGKYIAMFKDHPVQAGVRFLSPIMGWLLVIVGFWGLVLAWRKDHHAHAIVATILFYFISTHLITNVEPRYFYPAVPLLYPYAIFFLRAGRRLRSI